jgi:polysaccharide export outer membrane protein
MRPLCLILCLVLAGCSLFEGPAPIPPPAPPAAVADALKPGEALRITVAGEDELSGIFAVNSDSTIRMELLGLVRVAGLNPAGLEVELRRRLAAGYLKNPQVWVERGAQFAAPRLRPSL